MAERADALDLARLIAVARSYLGVPFRHCGRDRQGVDCVGLLLAAMREAGGPIYEPKSYARGDHSRLITEVERFARPAEGAPEPGDLLVMKVRSAVTHLALVSERQTIIHAHERVGWVVEQSLTDALIGRVFAVYRWRGAILVDR